MATTIPNIVNSLTGSTLDIQKLATDLVAASRAPQQAALDVKMTKTQAIISSVGRVVSAASAMQQGLSIYNPRTLAYLPQGGSNSSFTFHPSTPARAVDFSFQIDQVATVNSVVLPGITDDDFSKNVGIITITPKSPGTPIVIDLGAKDSSNNRLYNTVADLQGAIKDQIGFDASIVSTGGTSARNILTISHGTGVANQFSVSFDPANNALMPIVATSSGVDAKVTVGTEQITSKNNTFPDLVPDLIINISPTTPTDPPPTEHITTTSNTQKCKEALADIVIAYNQLMTTINNEIKYDKDVNKRGGLNNNSIARSFLWQMRDLTTTPVKISATKSVSLADVGVSTNLDGSLSLDETKLESIIANKPGLLESVLSTGMVAGKTVKGAIQRMNDMVAVIVSPTSSFNAIAQTAQKVDLPKIQAEETKLEDAMTALQAKYLQQFSAMQTAVQASQNTQSSLSQSMASWSAGLKG